MPSRYATWCSTIGAVLLVFGLPLWAGYERDDRFLDLLNPWLYVVLMGVVFVAVAVWDMRSGRK